MCAARRRRFVWGDQIGDKIATTGGRRGLNCEEDRMDFWPEAVGFLGSGFAVLTYWMRDMLPLRIAAVLSCLSFIAYAIAIGSLPLLMMEIVLLPINAYRLLELRRGRQPAQAKAPVRS
jgi:hypothetical protein